MNINDSQKKLLNFTMKAPWYTNKNKKGLVTVAIPHDPKILYGHNVLLAVMNSAETGESFANWEKHPSEEVQLRFLSGVVKVVVASTPQVFKTERQFHVEDVPVKGIKNPITIRLPISNEMYLGADTDTIRKKATCSYQNDIGEAW